MSNILRVVVEDAPSPVVPDDPVIPDDPVVPDVPVIPDDPTTPDEPIVPDTNSNTNSVPDTGRFTVLDTKQTNNINIAKVLPLATLGLVLLIFIISILKFHHKKPNFRIKLNSTKIVCFSTITILSLGAALFLTGSIFKNNSAKAVDETLDITSSDTTINITKETEVNYATAEVEITLNESTVAGYDLYVYAPNGNKLQPELPTLEKFISPVKSINSTLSANTYGISTSDEVTDEIWSPIPESETSPLMVISSSEATAADDKITFYYGVLIDQDFPAGTYATEIEYKAVPHYYTITFDPNGGTLNDTTKDIVAGAALGDLPIPIRTNYIFDGWYTDQTDGEEITTTTIPTQAITYYAHWTPTTATFTAGDNIETVIIADSSNNYKPFYATANTPIVFTQPAAGTKYIITVVPKANYKLSSWSGDTDTLADNSLLTTTYVVPDTIMSEHISLTATGEDGSYVAMQNLLAADCSATGTNVTDTRDGKSYTVAKFGSYCYMLSNLRLDNTTGGTTPRVLTDIDSNIIPNGEYTSFSMPTEAWTSSYQNYYCKAAMGIVGSEYYYNWYAATANPFSCSNPTGYSNADTTSDTKALGSICPIGWTLPSYNDYVDTEIFWSDARSLLITSGYFSSGSQNDIGVSGYSWFSTRYDNYGAYRLYFNGVSNNLTNNTKAWGLSIRCMQDH